MRLFVIGFLVAITRKHACAWTKRGPPIIMLGQSSIDGQVICQGHCFTYVCQRRSSKGKEANNSLLSKTAGISSAGKLWLNAFAKVAIGHNDGHRLVVACLCLSCCFLLHHHAWCNFIITGMQEEVFSPGTVSCYSVLLYH